MLFWEVLPLNTNINATMTQIRDITIFYDVWVSISYIVYLILYYIVNLLQMGFCFHHCRWRKANVF